jgi:hypothetical protein
MQYVTLTIQAEDFHFVMEAVRMRSRAILESLAMQVESQRAPAEKSVKVDAPWGLKKDGTPKKRPGRTKR